MLCNECLKRNACTELCEEAEKYANQDKPNYHKGYDSVHFTQMEKRILTLITDGKTRRQIRNILKLSPHTLRTHLYNLRTKRQGIVL